MTTMNADRDCTIERGGESGEAPCANCVMHAPCIPMRCLRSIVVCACVLVCTAAYAVIPAPIAQLLAGAGIPDSSVGLYVHEIGAGKPLVTHASEKPLNPASTMKLVTTYAALELLGPAYTWSTEVYAAGPLRNEVLEGDLVIKGMGDPKLTLESFWLLLRNLRARGVREIRGDLILDRTYFAAGDFDWLVAQLRSCG